MPGIRTILGHQERAGWGAKVIDQLSADLLEANPEMQGPSPRNLKYMCPFAAAWPDRRIVQRVVAQLLRGQNFRDGWGPFLAGVSQPGGDVATGGGEIATAGENDGAVPA
jgi:hypothetical protein